MTSESIPRSSRVRVLAVLRGLTSWERFSASEPGQAEHVRREHPGRVDQRLAGAGQRQHRDARRRRHLGRHLARRTVDQGHHPLAGGGGLGRRHREAEVDRGVVVPVGEGGHRGQPRGDHLGAGVRRDHHRDPGRRGREEAGDRRRSDLGAAVVELDLAHRRDPAGRDAGGPRLERSLGRHGQPDGAVRDHVRRVHRDADLLVEGGRHRLADRAVDPERDGAALDHFGPWSRHR